MNRSILDAWPQPLDIDHVKLLAEAAEASGRAMDELEEFASEHGICVGICVGICIETSADCDGCSARGECPVLREATDKPRREP
jgi:hypothetical protein